MTPIMLGAGASFIAGAAGYVIARYWIGPIRTYARAKAALSSELAALDGRIAEKGGLDLKSKPTRRLMKGVRRKANALLDCYQIELPVWYRLKLRSSGQNPEAVLPPLLGLHQLPTAGQITERVETVRRELQL
jgi:hypothetical protein